MNSHQNQFKFKNRPAFHTTETCTHGWIQQITLWKFLQKKYRKYMVVFPRRKVSNMHNTAILLLADTFQKTSKRLCYLKIKTIVISPSGSHYAITLADKKSNKKFGQSLSEWWPAYKRVPVVRVSILPVTAAPVNVETPSLSQATQLPFWDETRGLVLLHIHSQINYECNELLLMINSCLQEFFFPDVAKMDAKGRNPLKLPSAQHLDY